jgi:hypothetical protein
LLALNLTKLAYTWVNPTKMVVIIIYIFRDLIVDHGNNNKLVTIGKAKFLAYGRYFMDHKSTREVTNKKLLTNIL